MCWKEIDYFWVFHGHDRIKLLYVVSFSVCYFDTFVIMYDTILIIFSDKAFFGYGMEKINLSMSSLETVGSNSGLQLLMNVQQAEYCGVQKYS